MRLPICIAPQYIIELVCDVIAFQMDASSKQLHQAPAFGEDTDVIIWSGICYRLTGEFWMNSTA